MRPASATLAADPPPTADVAGTRLALTDYERAIDWIEATVRARGRGYVCVAATHTVMAAREDRELRAAVDGAAFTVPDGMPLVWALRALGHPLEDRVYGPTLMDRACGRFARAGVRAFLYGGPDDATLAELERRLRARHPGLEFAGRRVATFRALSLAEEAAVADAINAAAPDVVWVGLGVPRQEHFMARMRERLDAPVLVGVGAAFAFHAGLVAQAPPWLQRRGLEWLYRLLREPRRLWRRYARYNPRFVAAVGAQLWRDRRGR